MLQRGAVKVKRVSRECRAQNNVLARILQRATLNDSEFKMSLATGIVRPVCLLQETVRMSWTSPGTALIMTVLRGCPDCYVLLCDCHHNVWSAGTSQIERS